MESEYKTYRWDGPNSVRVKTNPIYICPKHGEIEAAIEVDISIPRFNGFYCIPCWVESLMKSGVCRVEEKK